MIYDFMLALAPSYYKQVDEMLEFCEKEGIETSDSKEMIEGIYLDACQFVNYILEEESV
jgi:hypothetical protein